jgi:serine/threonine protein kinase
MRDAPEEALFCPFCRAAIVPAQPDGAPADPLIGETIKGTYLVQELIGGGGMGKVYKATQISLGRPVALKLLRPSFQFDVTIAQRFHREARASSRLHHPNVIAVLDFGQTEDGLLFMAMEYVRGRNLYALLNQDFPLAEDRVVHLVAQILSALAEAHASGIVHRDLKPENVMVEARRDEPELVKVLDFGIAKVHEVAAGDTRLTQTGVICGTPNYMSPEQASLLPLDSRSDLYSVGVILYELLTGHHPFRATTPPAMAQAHVVEPPPPMAQRCSPGHTVSPALEAVAMRALQKNPDQRFQTAEEMRRELLACPLEPPAEGTPDRKRLTVALSEFVPTALLPDGATPARPRPAGTAATTAVNSGATMKLPQRTPAAKTVTPPPDHVPPPDPTGTPAPATERVVTDRQRHGAATPTAVAPETEDAARAPHAPAPARSRALPLALGAALVVVAAVGATMLLTRGRTAPPVATRAPSESPPTRSERGAAGAESAPVRAERGAADAESRGANEADLAARAAPPEPAPKPAPKAAAHPAVAAAKPATPPRAEERRPTPPPARPTTEKIARAEQPAPPAPQPPPPAQPQAQAPPTERRAAFVTREVMNFQLVFGDPALTSRGRALVVGAKWALEPGGKLTFAPVSDAPVFPVTVPATRDGGRVSFSGARTAPVSKGLAYVRIAGFVVGEDAPVATLDLEIGRALGADGAEFDPTYRVRARVRLAPE